MTVLSELLRELETISPASKEDTHQLQIQGRHAYEAVRRFMQKVSKTLPPEEAEDLVKRFFNAARTGDGRKLERGFDKITGNSSKPEED